jgi:hypothetical protein
MTDKPLTKAQLASLEGVYHKGDPYHLRTDTCANGVEPWFQYRGGAGGATTRMIQTLIDRGYLARDRGEPYKLTAKGYAALQDSKAAMKFIDEVELAKRWAARVTEEGAQQAAEEAERRQREERCRIAEETSRRERLAKLRELLSTEDLVLTMPFTDNDPLDDDKLLSFAARVHEIMEVY